MLVKLKELLTIKNGCDYKDLNFGNIPVIGTGGIITYVDKCLFNGEAILLPRKGSLNNVMYLNQAFWTVDTMFYAIPNYNKVNAKYLYYYLSLIDFTRLDLGSAIPSMTAALYYSLDINLPSLQVQNKIANILWSINCQIEKNNAMVKRLQVLAQHSFDYFYKNYLSDKPITINDIIIERDKSKIHVNSLDNSEGKIPFFTSGETILFSDNYLVNGFNIYLSTGGNAKVQSYYGLASYSTDTWCISAKNNLQYYLYSYLKHIQNQMDKLYFHGTGLKHLQKPVFLKTKINVLNEKGLKIYNSIVEHLFKEISKLTQSNVELEKLKNKLLPLLINQQLGW